MKYLLMLVVIILGGILFTGCTTASGFLLGHAPLPGNDGVSSLSQMKVIAENLLVVYDPEMGDAEFDEWVAKHEYDIARYRALMNIYIIMANDANASEVDTLTGAIDSQESTLAEVKKNRL